ncbi:hypothetical protein FQA47_004147 [Oryzias melastigma]|uniref:Uncharacterized protein n=1 Tax=Oryzias melastigma TaxID=30732 RepID=A0A834FFK2_ORYME|nr:hypothetical protein FQA47_004147 [Oryzias melastigma]
MRICEPEILKRRSSEENLQAVVRRRWRTPGGVSEEVWTVFMGSGPALRSQKFGQQLAGAAASVGRFRDRRSTFSCADDGAEVRLKMDLLCVLVLFLLSVGAVSPGENFEFELREAKAGRRTRMFLQNRRPRGVRRSGTLEDSAVRHVKKNQEDTNVLDRWGNSFFWFLSAIS